MIQRQMGAFKSYVMDEQEKREERILKNWCEEEGVDYTSLSEEEKANYWFAAEDWHEQVLSDNGQFGVGA